MPNGVATGKIVQGDERQQVITLCAQGFSVPYIARRFNRAEHTIEAVRDAEWSEITRRKPILAAQAERNALIAGEQIAEALAQRKFPVQSLPVVYGVSVDKVIAMRDPMSGSQQHLHLHLQPNDVVGRFNALLKSLEDKARQLPKPADTIIVNADNGSTADTADGTRDNAIATADSQVDATSEPCEPPHARSKSADKPNE